MRATILYSLMWGTILLTSCGQKTTTEKQQNVLNTPVTRVVQKEIILDKTYVADIQAARNVELRSRISGFLEKIYVDEGAFVKKGQLLFSLSSEEYQAEESKSKAILQSAIADARTVELESERIRLLVGKKIVASSELELAKAKLSAQQAKIAEAKAALDHARARLSYTKIYAPFDGIIDRIPLKAGSLLEEGSLITTVSDISSVFAYFNISENEYLEYLREKKDGQTANEQVELILADGGKYEFAGKLETVASEFQENTGSIAFRVRFPNPNNFLKHGASGKVSLSRVVKQAIVIPQKACFEVQDRNYVYLLGKDYKIHAQEFKPDTRLGNFFIVSEGLKSGDTIVYEGIQRLREGMKINPEWVTMDSLANRKLL
ncbi:MAG: efflux RND transporter periplasmic adaptor subunit [Bacteroidetes bacterium]|nr:efflux RND transporter periplasmic adaptor subunit [Bacteroidota bacterium]MBS1741248.1 efflux RND transporter periplasmic adaptor subunit [Bacteroidota bacterium]